MDRMNALRTGNRREASAREARPGLDVLLMYKDLSTGPETIEQNTKTKERTMPVELTERHDGKILEVQASGRLSNEDYRQFVPAFERLTKQHGKINVLFEMVDFHGWEAAALWDDLKFNLTHLSQIERLAMVGNKKWEQGMANFCAPFTHADVRFFDPTQFADARDWLGIPPML